MTAKEMFKELGFIQYTETYVEDELIMIKYTNVQDDYVEFNVPLKLILFKKGGFKSALLKAINKQCSELGWIDE